MKFIKKIKPLTKTIVTALLLLSIIITTPTITSFAATIVDKGDSANRENVETIRPDTSGKKHDTTLKQCDIGLRIYVTDAYGNVKQTDNGYDAIDFLYDTLNKTVDNSKLTGYNYNNYLRCTANPKQNYNITYGSMEDDLGFSKYETHHSKTNCICMQEYFVDGINHAKLGPTGHPIRQKLILTKGKDGGVFAEDNLIEKYWNNVYNEYVAAREADNSTGKTQEIELYMQVEVVFAIVHHVSEPDTPEWYGSVFEFGCYSDAENKKRINAKDTSKYVAYEANYLRDLPNSFYVSDTFDCFKGFPYMQSASYVNRKLKSSEMESKAYGMYQIRFSDIVRPDIKPEKTDPPVNEDIKDVQKEKAITMSKVQNEDVEIRTGYAAQNGYYDIGTDAGIPTTEEIRNVIEAQDCIIDYAYVFEKYVPEKFPTVTYTFDYYVPCTCPEETHEEDDYGYDRYGNYVVTGQHTVVDKPYGHHGSSYHRASDGYAGSSVLVKEFVIPRAAVYYRITDYKIYGLDSVFIQNECSNANYSNLSPIKEVKAVISGVTNPTSLSNTAYDTHIDFSEVKSLAFTHNDINGGVFADREAAENWINANGFDYGNEKVAVPKAANDSLVITFKDDRGTAELMSNEWCGREEMNSDYVVVPSTPTRKETAQSRLQKIYRDEQEHLEIPYELMNGNYNTTINAYYSMYAGTDKYDLYAWYQYDAAPNHIMDESFDLKTSVYNTKPTVNYASQEPIHVITPVISPFHTDDSNRMADLTEEEKNAMTKEEIKEYEREQSLTGTQLVNEADCQQLRLDETYTLTFEPAMHQVWLGYGYSGFIDNENYWYGYLYEGEPLESDNKYDKYVAEKYVKFPFDVYIQDILFAADTWICVYEYDAASQTVSAGDIKEPLLTDVEYYIPSWALSSMDEFTNNGMGVIETGVLALNYNDSDMHGTTYNAKDEETWSINAITVQLSGWIYDFKIIGTNDKMPWISTEEYNEYWQGYQGAQISFSDRKDEFYMGKYNRLGNDNTGNDTAQRRDRDGSLDTDISEEKDILPLSYGSSECAVEAGYLGLGSEFGFTLKTMDNLDDTDKIVIIPTFTYYSDNVENPRILTMDDMELYYTNPATHQVYSLYGSETDTDFLVNNYNNKYNDSVIAFDEYVYTAKHNSKAASKWFSKYTDIWIEYLFRKNEKTNIGSLSKITLTDGCMTYSEVLSELKLPQYTYQSKVSNVERDEETKLYENILGPLYKDGNISLSSKEDNLKQSVQQWAGNYFIPGSLQILDLEKLHEMGYSSLMDYFDKETYVFGDEDFWINMKCGHLVLNFQITVYKDGEEYMTMESGSSDQWIRQGRKDEIQINTFYSRKRALEIMGEKNVTMPEALRIAAEEMNTIIKMKSGDVAVINLGEHVNVMTTKAVAWS